MVMLKHIYVDVPLKVGEEVKLPRDVARRLTRVLRYKVGHKLAVFNGVDGLFEAVLTEDGGLDITEQLAAQPEEVARALYICLPKKETFSRVLRQATEMGVSDIYPLYSDHTVPDKLNIERCSAILVEAAEQCERLSLPRLHAPQKLAEVDFDGQVLWAAERSEMRGEVDFLIPQTFSEIFGGVLVGPEGGFSAAEVAQLRADDNAVAVSLGDTILRTDTAVVVGLGKLLS